MIILALYPVDNSLDWDRHEFDCLDDDMVFKKFWEERESLGAKFYNMSTKSYGDRFGQYGFSNADEFEDDFNDEVLDDGGWWCKVLTIGEDWVWEVINYGR